MAGDLLTVRTSCLDIACEAHGDPNGFPIVLLHGFPDDVRAWDDVVPPLAVAGHRVLVPYLRGYGPTRFLDPRTPRMAQQAAIGQDLIELIDALRLPRVALSGYDWGGRAACIASILAPERVRALVTIGGYNVQNTVRPSPPASAVEERAYWYQWYFNTERGRAGLEANRRDICRLLWRDWCPSWHFDEATFERTARSFDNPDWVEVVIHSYRHRHGNAPGDPPLEPIEKRLAERPAITVPTIVLHGAEGSVTAPERSLAQMALFPPGARRRVIADAGHFLPRQAPGAAAVTAALLELLA